MRAPGLLDADRYALGVLNAVLGGGMSSRLFTEVRERRGLCYYVYSHHDAYTDAGSLVVAAGVDVAKRAASNPLGRMGVADDVARVVVFAASDMAAFMTGHTIAVDAGRLA